MRAIVALALLSVAACTTPEPTSSQTMTTGRALAQLACPHRIAEAYAWVSHMPGPGRSPRELQVDVGLAEPTDTAVILKSVATTGDTLVLEIRTAPTAPMPGRVTFREPTPDPMYKRVSFFCRGGEIFSLEKIEKVY